MAACRVCTLPADWVEKLEADQVHQPHGSENLLACAKPPVLIVMADSLANDLLTSEAGGNSINKAHLCAPENFTFSSNA